MVKRGLRVKVRALEGVREVFRSCLDCVEWFHGSNRAPKIGKIEYSPTSRQCRTRRRSHKSQINKHSQIRSDVILHFFSKISIFFQNFAKIL
jgi:hypothetical protein